jgi:hypothetical protein
MLVKKRVAASATKTLQYLGGQGRFDAEKEANVEKTMLRVNPRDKVAHLFKVSTWRIEIATPRKRGQ